MPNRRPAWLLGWKWSAVAAVRGASPPPPPQLVRAACDTDAHSQSPSGPPTVKIAPQHSVSCENQEGPAAMVKYVGWG